jgi:hypothetical protein
MKPLAGIEVSLLTRGFVIRLRDRAYKEHKRRFANYDGRRGGPAGGRSGFGRGRTAFSRSRLFGAERRRQGLGHPSSRAGLPLGAAVGPRRLPRADGVTRDGEKGRMFGAAEDRTDAMAFARRRPQRPASFSASSSHQRMPPR